MTTTTNDKSCLLDAAAHVLVAKYNAKYGQVDYMDRNQLVQEMIASIGHDGSERGFHTQEIQDELRTLDVIVQKHELYPCLQLPPGEADLGRVRVIPIYERDKCEEIFLSKINSHDGVLICRSRAGVHHALAFTAGSNTAYDVAKDVYVPLEDLDIVMYLEFINEAYKAQQKTNGDSSDSSPGI